MLHSLALLLVVGYALGTVARKMKMPPLLGMLLAGVLLGPSVFDLLSSQLLTISQELRSLALIIILLRAGLGLRRSVLGRVGKTALLLSSLPCVLEGFAIMYLSTLLLGFDFVQGGMLGFIIAAVSPAVVVPSMLQLKEEGLGERKAVPTLILAGASVDDVFAITLFSAFVGLNTGGDGIIYSAVRLPINIMLGIVAGGIVGYLLLTVYNNRQIHIRNTEKLVLLLASSILLYTIGEGYGIASLLGVMTIGFTILERREGTAEKFAHKLNRVWVFAEILLFSLVGAAVNISVAFDAGLVGLSLIILGLVGRGIGVFVATIGSELNWKERLFCLIAYTPKATVQAAIGGIPLGLGIAGGDSMLAIAVLAIMVTAPLGAIGIKLAAPRLLATD